MPHLSTQNQEAIEQFLQQMKEFKPFEEDDDYRAEDIDNYGGFPLNDTKVTQMLRNAIKGVVTQIGK